MLGRTVSHYRILDKLGAGGMGIVYSAEDLRLDRKVALKFLPELSGIDELAVERFSREARAASALNHPNICTLYDVGEIEGRPFLVMELLEGRTLRQRLQDGPLPPGEAIEIAIQVTDALSAAHSRGILHRDLKPANLFLTGRGHAKILDFGLAKKLSAPSTPGGDSETLTATEALITGPGTAVGTVAYMSPEQARGQELDARSDLFSLGIVLYEMASGALPFPGSTSAVIFDAILNRPPEPLARRNPNIRPELERIVFKLLEKDRALRYQSAADLYVDLKLLHSGRSRREWRIGRRVWIAAAGGIAVAAAGIYFARPPGAPSVSGATFTQLTSEPGEETFPSISPDGKTLAYARRGDIYTLRVGGRNALNLTRDGLGNTEPSFSPDGEQIAFHSDREGGGIFVMGATGESMHRIMDFGHAPTWSPDGKRIGFVTETVGDPTGRPPTSRLWIVDLATGGKTQLSQADAIQPSWSPHGYRIAFAGSIAGRRDLWTISANGGDPVPVTQDRDVDWSPAWSPDGRFLYFASDRGGRMNLWRLRIDEGTGRVRGQPEPVTTPSPYSGTISIARDGRRIVYTQWIRNGIIESMSFDPAREKAIGVPKPLAASTKPAFNPEPSPDGKWLAFSSLVRPEDILVVGTDGGNLNQLTDDDFVDRFVRWSPDGSRIAFQSDRSGKYQIWLIHRDGSGLTQITDEPAGVVAGPVWSPDGTRLLYNRAGDVPRIVDMQKRWAEQTPETLPPHPSRQFWGYQWSADGKMVAGWAKGNTVVYYVDERKYVDVVPVEDHYPVFLRDNRWLLFREKGSIHAINIHTGQRHEALSPAPLTRYSLSADNRTIYYSHETSEADIFLMTLK